MSSRDKVPSATRGASKQKASTHKAPTRQHQSPSSSSSSSSTPSAPKTSSTPLSRNNTANNNNNNSSAVTKSGSQTKKTTTTESSKKPSKQQQKAVEKGQRVSSSSRGRFRTANSSQDDSSSENKVGNSREMATTKSAATDEVLFLHCNAAEQETDVDDDPERRLLDDQEEAKTNKPQGAQTSDANIVDLSSKSFGQEAATTTAEAATVDTCLPAGWEQHTDKAGPYFWHVSTGVIQRTRPSSELPLRRGSSVVVYHDDEEINQAPKTSSDEEDYYESGAALTVDDTSESTFVVYPLGCCEFDETQLMSATSSKAIQKCILRLSNTPSNEEETVCWGLDQSQPIMMKLFDDHIQFTDLKTQLLLRSQPIQTIKTWAVDDNNNFAFVVEDRAQAASPAQSSSMGADRNSYLDTVDYALISEPVLMCYVFRSVDEDDMMSCKVAAKLNEEINRYKEQMLNRMTKSTRLQQMVEMPTTDDLGSDVGLDEEEDFDELEASNELTMNVKYIGKIPVPRPTGIDVLNVAIDKCLADATIAAQQQQQQQQTTTNGCDRPATTTSSDHLIEAKIHVSPSSVIVENVTTGEIIVECRIRYLTFMGISKRDIRWCGFIMQNATNKTFVAHCFECHPTAGHVCEAIQVSCSRMYEKVVKNNARQPETMSIIPTSSKIRNTLAKTLSRIKLNPLR